MLCQECGKKPATLHFTKIVNGEKTEFHICESCARERGEGIPGTSNGFSIHSLLSGLLDFEQTRFGNAVASPADPLRKLRTDVYAIQQDGPVRLQLIATSSLEASLIRFSNGYMAIPYACR